MICLNLKNKLRLFTVNSNTAGDLINTKDVKKRDFEMH